MEKTNLGDHMKEYKERIHSKTYKANTDLSLYSAGIEQCKSEYTYGPIVRSYYVMHFVFSGKGQLTINEHSFDVKAGDIFLIPANKVATYQADKNHPWKYGWVNFLGINAEQYFYSLTKDTHDQYVIHNVDVNKYYKQIERLLDLSFNTDAEYFESNSILLHIFAMLYEELNIHFNNNVKYSLAEEIRLYLDLNYQYNLKMSEIADKFGIHANYMTRLFHQKFDISPKQYLLSIKLKKAAGLLQSTNLPVSTIAASVGFIDALAFSKKFSKTYHCSPTQYRKQTNEKKN